LGALAAVALIAVLALGGDDGSSERKASTPAPAREAQKEEGDARSPAAQAPPQTPAPAGAPAQTPTQTVNGFYQHAASHDYDAAWAMLTEGGRAQLGSQDSFAAGQSSLRSISFPTLRTTSETSDAATVELRSEAVHTDRTDNVCGTVDLVRSGTAWLLNAFHLDTCRPSQLYPGGRKQGKFPKSPKPSKARGDPGAEGGD
jgi:hypothetical protein